MARKITVLLVENDMVVRGALEHALTVENFNVLTASSAAGALQHLLAYSIEIILIDADLSSHDGGRLFSQIKERHPLVATIVMTADDAVSLTWPGVAAWVEKPLNLPDLFGKIEELAASALSAH